MFFSIIYNKRVFEGERPVVCCWRGFWQHLGAFRGSTKKLYSEDLSGILRLGFRQNSVFQDFIGHIAVGLPTEFKICGS